MPRLPAGQGGFESIPWCLGQGRCLVNICGMYGHTWGTFPPPIFTAFKAFNPGVTSSREILACFLKMAATIKRDSGYNPSVWRGRVPATSPSKMCLLGTLSRRGRNPFTLGPPHRTAQTSERQRERPEERGTSADQVPAV